MTFFSAQSTAFSVPMNLYWTGISSPYPAPRLIRFPMTLHLMEVEEEDLDFEALVRELSSDISAAEYVNFDADIPASEPMINEHEIDWRQKIREDCTNAIMNPNTLSEETQEISDDDDDGGGGDRFCKIAYNARQDKEMFCSR